MVTHLPEAAENSQDSNKSVITSQRDLNKIRLLAELELLRDRLRDENETELLAQIAPCQKLLVLKCQTCNSKKTVAQRCKRRWCPCCSKQLAATRARELDFIVERMRWPLFVTLTMKHDSLIKSGDVRHLVRSFGKLRHRKLWTKHTQGGVATVELTNDAGGWHPHMHSVIDSKWLAVKTPPPRYRATSEEWLESCTSAAKELGSVWAKILGQPTASVRVKRANKLTIAKEVTKYTVKNEDLVCCTGSAGDLIRSLDKTRAMRTFGRAHGQCVKDIRQLARASAKAELKEYRNLMSDFDCCPAPDLLPESVFISDPEARCRKMGTTLSCTVLKKLPKLDPWSGMVV